MLPRLAAGALLASGALALAGAGPARAEPAVTGRGAVVVAVGDDAASAARPLALDVYRDPALRPSVDDATARVLAGEPPPEGSPAKLRELASLRASLAHPPDGGEPAESGSGELVTRRLLASIGADAHAVLVVAVTMQAGRPTARALSVGSSSWQGVEIGATATSAADGSTAFTWPGAVTTLHTMLPKEAAPLPAPKPKAAPPRAAPTKESPERAKDRSFWTSPWFWVGLGAVVATGVTVFVVTKEVQDDSGTIHVDGRVPR